MSNFIYILTNILLPIFLVIGIGYAIQKKFSLDIASLVKVHLFVFIPSMMFYNVYFNTLTGDFVFKIMGGYALIFLIMMVLATILGKVLKLERAKEKAFVNAVSLNNQGNYGVPLMTLLFAGPLVDQAVSIQLTVMLTASLLINTIGLYNASSGSYTGKEALTNILRIPLLYAILAALLMRVLGIGLWEPVVSAIEIMKTGLVPVALFILGAQLAMTPMEVGSPLVLLTTAIRLLAAPLIALLLVKLAGFEGILAQMLVIGASFPTAVNTVILSIEFKGDSDFASQTVLVTTVLSAVTVSLTIGLVMQFM